MSKAFASTSLLATTDRKGRYFSAISAFAPGRPSTVSVRNPSGIEIGCSGAMTWLSGDKIFPGTLDTDKRYSGWFDKFRTSSSTPLNKNTFEFSPKIRRAS